MERCTARAPTAKSVFLDILAVDSLVSAGVIQIVGIAFTC